MWWNTIKRWRKCGGLALIYQKYLIQKSSHKRNFHLWLDFLNIEAV